MLQIEISAFKGARGAEHPEAIGLIKNFIEKSIESWNFSEHFQMFRDYF